MSDAATFDCMCFGGSIIAMVEPNKHAITATATEDFMLMSKLQNETYSTRPTDKQKDPNMSSP
jgi:hypothetical protein